MKNRSIYATLLMSFLAISPGAIASQSLDFDKLDKATRYDSEGQEQIPVAERTASGFDVQHIRIGSFIVQPSVRLHEIMTTNVFATSSNEKSDLITILAPGIRVRTFNPDYGFKFDAEGELGYYNKYNNENYTNYHTSLRPFVLITRAAQLRATMAHQRNQLLRSDESSVAGTDEPVNETRTTGRAEFEYKPARFGLLTYGERVFVSHNNVALSAGGISVNNDRNRFEDEIGLKLSFELSDKSAIYWLNRYLHRDYKRREYDNLTSSYSGTDRDSHGVASALGIKFNLTKLVSVDANAGGYSQNFNDSSLKDINTGIGHLLSLWQVTPLTNISLGADRQIFETIQPDASAFVQNSAEGRIDHELRRNIVLNGRGEIGRNLYQGAPRTDDYWLAGFGAIYKMNRNLHWRLDYIYDQRDSNSTLASYDQHRVLLGARVQF